MEACETTQVFMCVWQSSEIIQATDSEKKQLEERSVLLHTWNENNYYLIMKTVLCYYVWKPAFVKSRCKRDYHINLMNFVSKTLYNENIAIHDYVLQ